MRNDDGVDHDKSFHYRLVIEKLNYLEKATRPDISFATHQCAHFAGAPKKSHTRAVHWLLKPKSDKVRQTDCRVEI